MVGAATRYSSVSQYRSVLLGIITWMYLLFPIWYLLAIHLAFEVSWSSVLKTAFSFFYWFLSILALSTAWGLWNMRVWAWYVFLSTVVLILYKNLQVLLVYSESENKAVIFFATLSITLLIAWRVKREICVPYILPKIRWWESLSSSPFRTKVKLKKQDGKELLAEVLDISAKGCFVKTQENFVLDDKVQVQLRLFGFDIHCEGTVVWRAPSAVTHPRGIGVKFIELNKTQRRQLRIAVYRLQRIEDLRYRYAGQLSEAELMGKFQEKKYARVLRDLRSLEADDDLT